MGHPALRNPARRLEPAEIGTDRIQQLVDDMIDTMREYQGIGLAAPQVHESLRLFVAGLEGDDEPLPLVTLINPEIEPVGSRVSEDWEGCLSIPDLRGRVTRPEEILVHALDRHGRNVEMQLTGYPSRVVQHETDHLDGILFLDRMTSLDTLSFFDEFARYWSEPEAS